MSRTLCRTFYLLLIINSIHTKTQISVADYLEERRVILETEYNKTVGARIFLKENEKRANDIIMQLKLKETARGFQNSSKHHTSKHFFKYKNQIEKSKLFQIVKMMPKGAALHVHASLAMTPAYMVSLTYMDHLYVCYTTGEVHDMIFSLTTPQKLCIVEWQRMRDLRHDSGDIQRFDKDLEKLFSIHLPNEKIETDINKVWVKFDNVHKYTSLLISYRPAREKHFYDLLKTFYEDGVIYIEIRSGCGKLYELDGRTHDRKELFRLYQRVAKKFANEHQDFVGIKIILTAYRGYDIDHIRDTLNLAREIKSEMPEIFAGFDLVGQEDKGRPLLDFLPALLEAKDDIDFYFHGGETNWYGMPTDENLIDAILLGTKRIGHAYSLIKHPYLLKTVKENNIAIEVNVISNNVLALVNDVRNHPLAVYLSLGMPVVLSGDDPGVWGATPMSHDFYVSFQCIANIKSDIRTLKQLAINSIRYSALSNSAKAIAYNIFHRQWNIFINSVISSECL